MNYGDGFDATERGGDVASKLLSGTAGRVAGGIGKFAGRAGKAYSVAMAALEFGSCAGW